MSLADRAIVTDDVEKSAAQMRAWIADPAIDVVITTGGTGFTGRDVTPEAVEPLFEKRMDGFSIVFHMVSHAKIGSSTIQSRATAGVAGATFIFCLPGSPGACRDAWDEILVHQLDYRYRPCNFVELMPRLDEHHAPAQGQGRDGVMSVRLPVAATTSKSQCSLTTSWPKLLRFSLDVRRKPACCVDVARGGQHAVGPERDPAIAALAGEADALVRQPRAECRARAPIGSTRSRRSRATFALGILDQQHAADVAGRPSRRSSSVRISDRTC